ncbi:FGF [Adoxophyes orana nucleopolyhedrovirus]|uniref:FGF n=1 Tax=Adoxophyes orana nucleopolyhedrovirus TaxID=542343 RepID=UPI0001829C3A|nr:FGF [Adoxophyes orana nucleopolyhedrovirus]ACF05399.1 FGF [Adoxophyes orana nucleopolyhedrovirus]
MNYSTICWIVIVMGVRAFPTDHKTVVKVLINHKLLYDCNNGTLRGIQNEATLSDGIYWQIHKLNAEANTILMYSAAFCNFLCINACGYYYIAKNPNYDCVLTEHYAATHALIYKKLNDTNALVAINKENKMRKLLIENLNQQIKLLDRAKINYTNAHKRYASCVFNMQKITTMPAKKCDSLNNRSEYDDKSVETYNNFYNMGKEEVHFKLLDLNDTITAAPMVSTTHKNSNIDIIVSNLLENSTEYDYSSEYDESVEATITSAIPFSRRICGVA